jgi:hypothetical protein
MDWDDDELAALRWHWGDAYEITVRGGIYRAVRRDDRAAVTATTAERLEAEIRADYQVRPVPRNLPVMGQPGDDVV